MGKYVIKRLLLLIPILLGVSFIIFTIMNMIPGDVASLVLGDNAPLSAREELTRELGLDKPFWLRYVDYVLNALQGNFGLSYRTRTPVFTEIFSRFPTTMKLAAGAMLLSVAIGVPLGILSAVKQYSALDVINSVTAMFFSSIPAFWLGLLSILLFALKLGWLPSNGADSFKSFILPIVTLALPGGGGDPASDPFHHAGSHPPGLYPYRKGKGSHQHGGHMEACPEKCAFAGHHSGRYAFRRAVGRFCDHRVRIRHAGSGDTGH